MFKKASVLCVAAAALLAPMFLVTASATTVTWDAFVVRNGDGTTPPTNNSTTPVITKTGPSSVEVSLWLGSQKAGFGTDYFNGMTLSNVKQLTYTRTDSGTTTSSPYVNIWVTDGTNYAVIAPHSTTNGGPSPSFGGVPSDIQGNNVNGLDLQTLGFSVYENSDGTDYSWLYPNAVRPNGTGVLVDSSNSYSVITLADIGNLTVENPNSVSGSGWTGGSGAAKGSNGFVIMFGNTQLDQSNEPLPYELSNVGVVVPVPATLPAGLALLGLCGVGLLIHRRWRAA